MNKTKDQKIKALAILFAKEYGFVPDGDIDLKNSIHPRTRAWYRCAEIAYTELVEKASSES